MEEEQGQIEEIEIVEEAEEERKPTEDRYGDMLGRGSEEELTGLPDSEFEVMDIAGFSQEDADEILSPYPPKRKPKVRQVRRIVRPSPPPIQYSGMR